MEDSTTTMAMRLQEQNKLLVGNLKDAIREIEHAKNSFEELRMMLIQGDLLNEGTLRAWANRYRRSIARLEASLPGA